MASSITENNDGDYYNQPNTTPMRQIKFRCYDKVNKEFVSLAYGTSLTPSELEARDKGDQYEITQWTGLTDKAGVEIYEGDIVRQKTGRAYTEDRVVRFDAGAFRFQNQLTKHGCYIYTNQNTEVIGNIYKNKDLL